MSEEAKGHAREVLGEHDAEKELHETRVNAGYKAALKSESFS